MIEELYSAKVAVVKQAVAVADTKGKKKTYIDSNKSQNIFIALMRLPKANEFIRAVENLNDKMVSNDNLASLLKNWPSEDFEGLM